MTLKEKWDGLQQFGEGTCLCGSFLLLVVGNHGLLLWKNSETLGREKEKKDRPVFRETLQNEHG